MFRILFNFKSPDVSWYALIGRIQWHLTKSAGILEHDSGWRSINSLQLPRWSRIGERHSIEKKMKRVCHACEKNVACGRYRSDQLLKMSRIVLVMCSSETFDLWVKLLRSIKSFKRQSMRFFWKRNFVAVFWHQQLFHCMWIGGPRDYSTHVLVPTSAFNLLLLVNHHIILFHTCKLRLLHHESLSFGPLRWI